MNKKIFLERLITSKRGYALVTTLALLVTFLIGGSAYLTLSVNEVSLCKRQTNSTKAFFLADAGIQRALYNIKNGNMANETFTLGDISSGGGSLDDIDISTSIMNVSKNKYDITSTSSVGSITRTIYATALNQPPAKVFDYAYFLNNWGWFYGSGITSNGDIRSNGRFDFRGGPTVNGHIYAAQDISTDGSGIRGTGGNIDHQHPNSPKVDMPNLEDLDYYESVAIREGGNIVIDGNVVVDAVYGDDSGESGNLVLVGTPAKPIEITGPVVIRGDVIIEGTVTGQGTIYTGRNIYVVGDIQYANGPATPRPASDDPGVIDAWANANKDRDILGLSARENIIIGDYTKSPNFGYTGGDRWYSDLYLFDMGSEDVGVDGIPGTGDEGENDGQFDAAFEDLDGDGEFDDNYAWADVETSVPIAQFSNLPPGVTTFSDIATNYISRLDGILYTNHAVAARVGSGVNFNGSVISKDEAILYRDTIIFNYDERIHSRYRDDQNWLIDLLLPVAVKVQMLRWWEE